VQGTAWLVSDQGHLLTAGHLLGEDKPYSEVEVQFEEDILRRAECRYWLYQKYNRIDFAVLQLTDTLDDRRPLPISLARDVEGGFRVRGYGITLEYQSSARGQFLGPFDPQGSPSNRLFQLKSPELEGGFSGAAVFSDELGAVVGIVTEGAKAKTGPGRDTRLAMPLYRIAREWEQLTLFAKPGYAYEKSRGSEILQLFNGLDTEPLIQSINESYVDAYSQRSENPTKAIDSCQKGLRTVETQASIALGNPFAFVYAKGKFYLLIGSICLDQGALRAAEAYYIKSRDEFHSGQWSHVESLAYLAQAITYQELKDFGKALEVCQRAQDSASHESVGVDTTDLREAISKELRAIQKSLPTEELQRPEPRTVPGEAVKELSAFDIEVGRGIIAEKATTDLNLLRLMDYSQVYERDPSKEIGTEPLSLIDFPDAKWEKYYFISVDKDAKTDNDLQKNTKVLIREEDNPIELHGKKVAVLIIDHIDEKDETYVTLKTFYKADDHYFLRAESEDASTPSIVVSHYKSPQDSHIRKYYEQYEQSGEVIYKRVYEVRVSGEVRHVFPSTLTFNVYPTGEDAESAPTNAPTLAALPSPESILEIPIVSDIAAGIGRIAEENIEERLFLDEDHCNRANFGVRVVGDSMNGHGIFPGDIALIRIRREDVEIGQVVAAVITTEMESEGVLKIFRHHERQGNLRHAWLESCNSLSEDLVVIPSGADVDAIKAHYSEAKQAGKISKTIRYYENAKLTIVGEYVGLVRRA
jgi:SOS-response transcriptional repressor LexA